MRGLVAFVAALALALLGVVAVIVVFNGQDIPTPQVTITQPHPTATVTEHTGGHEHPGRPAPTPPAVPPVNVPTVTRVEHPPTRSTTITRTQPAPPRATRTVTQRPTRPPSTSTRPNPVRSLVCGLVGCPKENP